MGRNTRLRLVFPSTILSRSSSILRALLQNKAQSRLLYLLTNKAYQFSMNFAVVCETSQHLSIARLINTKLATNIICSGSCIVQRITVEINRWRNCEPDVSGRAKADGCDDISKHDMVWALPSRSVIVFSSSNHGLAYLCWLRCDGDFHSN